MSQSSIIEKKAFVSVKLVTMDHYMASPITDLDVAYSSFRSSITYKVPVLRVFGPTRAGQKSCLHIHGIFPYMYVPKPTEAPEGFIYQLAASIDKAINITLLDGGEAGKSAPSSQHHVFKVSLFQNTFSPSDGLFFCASCWTSASVDRNRCECWRKRFERRMLNRTRVPP